MKYCLVDIKGQYLALLVATVFSCGCSSSTYERLQASRDSGRAHAAAYAAEGFTMDHRTPESRPFRAWQFYFKNCALVSRNPYPNRTEYECADPR